MSIKCKQYWCALVSGCLAFHSAIAADGTFNVTESWSVTIDNPAVSAHFTRTGVESGAVQITAGRYMLINHTGADLGTTALGASITGTGTAYSTRAEPFLYGFTAIGAQYYAVVKLSFFVVLVPLQSDWGFTLFSRDDVYVSTGTSPTSLNGFGLARDGNNATYQASSIASLAGFVDTTPPTLSISSPTPGQRWSNAVINVTGAASDNVGVAAVYCSLNGSAWTNAATVNNWAIWNCGATLIPGTNTIAAYAVDTSGNPSTISQLSFDYVLNAALIVRSNGNGTISPNYNGTLLQVAHDYSMTAAAASGFAFQNWTDGTGSVVTNGATLKFIMASNLTFTASFVDTTRPTLNITAPTTGQQMTSAVANIVGTAADNWGVAGVWCQLNNGPWNAATTTNGWTNWATTSLLAAGTNSLKAYAVDRGGNLSTTNNLSLLSSNAFKLRLSLATNQPMAVNGLGIVLQLSPGVNGHILVSSNLASWTTLTNFVGTNSTLTFFDPAATNSSRRFYRAVIP